MRLLRRRHAPAIDLNDANTGTVAPTTPRRFGTSHAPTDGSRLHPSRMHFERLVSGGHQHALLKCDPYGDAADLDGDAIAAVSRHWDVPTTKFRRPMSAQPRVSKGIEPSPPPPPVRQQQHEEHPGSQVTARPSARPRSAVFGGRQHDRKTPKVYPREEEVVDVLPSSTTHLEPAPTPRPPKPQQTFTKVGVFGRAVGREAPLPGYMALLGAASAATVAQANAAKRSQEGALFNAAAISLAESKHGAPFAWLSNFDSTRVPAVDRYVPSARIGSGFTFGWASGDGTVLRRPRSRGSSPNAEASTSAPVAQSPTGGRFSRPPQIEVRGVKSNSGKFKNRGASTSHPTTNWHGGALTRLPREGLCASDMAKETGRDVGVKLAESSSSVGMPLKVLEKTSQATQRHVATVSIGSQTPRPPAEFKSASMGISLFVKHTLVEPTVLTPRFGAPTIIQRSPSTSPRRAV